jgi:outer membrane phospholipase A
MFFSPFCQKFKGCYMKVGFVILILLTASFAHGAESMDTVTVESGTKNQDSLASVDPGAGKKHETLDSFFTLYQPYLTNISHYNPMYFLVGTDPAKSKFQFSFRYRFLNPAGSLAKKHPWVKGFHFGYTQTSFWNLESSSAPFEDTSYKPEFFHITTNFNSRPSWMQGLFLITGVQHESNGRADEFSRGFNSFYIRSVFIFYNEKTKLGMGIYPKFKGYLSTSDWNADIEDYRGYFELGVTVGKADSFILRSDLSWAKEGGSVQLDLTYPMGSSLFDNINIYLHVQYVSALAESLLNYQERTNAVRIGFSFVR